MLTLWIVVVVLGVLEIFETGLLLFLLRGLGKMKQQGVFSISKAQPFDPGGLNVGEKAPSFVAVNQDGQTVRLEDVQGRRSILAFVSPGCTPCATTIEVLHTFLQEGRDIVVLVVGSVNREQNDAYAVEHHAQIPVLTPDADVNTAYQVQIKPFVFVLDEDGIVRAKGGMNDREHLEALLMKAFPTQTVPHTVLPVNH